MDIATIIAKIKEGDHAAFKQLVYLYTGKLMVVAKIYTRNEEDAKDVLQDSFILIYQNIDQFKDGHPKAFLAWMKKIVLNSALSKYKRKRYELERYNLDEQDEKGVAPLVIQNLENQDLLSAIYQLPLKYKQVIGMYAIEGYSHKEIADLLGIADSSSRSMYTRAKQLLKKYIIANKMVV